MNIFLDANIIVSVLNKEYPLFSHTSRIMSLADHPRYKVFTSPVCLAIAFYFAEKKHRTKLAREKINILCDHLSVAGIDESIVRRTIANSTINDFEDALEYYSAIENKCTCIITEDVKDFYFSDIEVLTAADFYDKYLAGHKKL